MKNKKKKNKNKHKNEKPLKYPLVRAAPIWVTKAEMMGYY